MQKGLGWEDGIRQRGREQKVIGENCDQNIYTSYTLIKLISFLKCFEFRGFSDSEGNENFLY